MTIAAPARAPLGTVGTLVGDQIGRLQRGYLDDRSESVAALARLRRGAGEDPLAVPDLWGLIELDGLHEDADLSSENSLIQAQNAVCTAMTLWALHQQSRRTGMHRTGGLELGSAVRRLMPVGAIDEPVRKRFVRVGSAPSLKVLSVRMRDLVTLLRRDEIGLDYALLADQLHLWQRPGGRDGVRRSWGRSFHAAVAPMRKDSTPAESPTADPDGDDVSDRTSAHDDSDTKDVQ
ncbi:type I-E CRISPR-associated protein Cse2/CasB [Streptomyces sp. NBC_00564]|uniref:type I-E CRISPR-associated protein Cse2/CasB n=1 Tax=Streptomyces sp. NBC_00564 TaxID=2903663 RepID=UPI00352F9A0F|nr:type I-E CRISPR-associated protein Cse2/CasB [Streptomyces sp. NBC_00564]